MEKKFIRLLSVALICIFLVSCFSGCTPKEEEVLVLSADLYLQMCQSHGFDIYAQNIPEDHENGVITGFSSSIMSIKTQYDFYGFESTEYADKGLKRIQDWILYEYGGEPKETKTKSRVEWVVSTEEIYFKAVKQGLCLTFILSLQPDFFEHAEIIISTATAEN